MNAAPSGAVTFLFTDVEGSTRLWENRPDEMRSALADHDEILRSSIGEANGLVFSTAGDAFAAAFQDPADAVAAAEIAQRGLDAHTWPGEAALRVRMGLHTGVAHQRDGDYFGPTLNRAARLMSAAHGGQVVLSGATGELVSGKPLLDMGEHRLKDLSRPEHVWQLLVEGLAREFPPLRTLNAVPTNLPSDLGSFVGRDDEIAALMGDLAKNRLVVMTGVGGVGKTRLSLQVAADASHHYPQGLYFVELAPVRLGEAVEYALLESLGVEALPAQSPLQAVIAKVADGAMLLVVDNCEHVSGAAASAIGQLLAACPNVKVLASSRRSLGLAGEQIRRVQPLATGSGNSAAVQLFLDRAAAAGQSALENRSDVVLDICRRLDGVPLAIELAAARTRSMTPEEIGQRLDERFRLLKGGRSAGNERHQTLLSTIEWSYQLLDDDQKLLFQRLSVFAGSFTLSAAEQVCSDERLDDFDVLDLLDELVDQSLVVADLTGTTTRYRMLESLRQFAQAELGADIRALRDRHARWHVEWAESVFARQVTAREEETIAELEAAWNDIRAAALHCADDLDLLGRLLAALFVHALFRWQLEPGEWALAGLAVAEEKGASDEARSSLLAVAAGMSGLAGLADRAVSMADAFVDLHERTGLPLVPQLVVAIPGVILGGRPDLADRIQDIGDRTAPANPPSWVPVLHATCRAITSTYLGRPEAAREASLRAKAVLPPDLSPTLSALAGWMIAMHGGGTRAEVVAQMERVIEQAYLVRSGLYSIFRQYLASVRAELGDLQQPMREAAENFDTLLAQNQLGLAVPAVRRAGVLLAKAGRAAAGITLLGWAEASTSTIVPTPDLAAEMDELIPQVRQSLGDDFEAAWSAGVGLGPIDAMTFARAELLVAVEALAST